jgi:DHA1 family bicyclomycin/chloramphenicol resistance-like MFS transporter
MVAGMAAGALIALVLCWFTLGGRRPQAYAAR